MTDQPGFADPWNPTSEEIRGWAYRGALEPVQDWQIIIAELDHLPMLLDCLDDPACPSRPYLLSSLYCLAGHLDRTDPRLLEGVARAERSEQRWLTVWAGRVRKIISDPASFDHSDWCGWRGLADRPDG